MKEITDKLASELVEKLDKLEGWCDGKVKQSRGTNEYTDWMTTSVMCHDIRQHLYWHMQDMIKHEEAE